MNQCHLSSLPFKKVTLELQSLNGGEKQQFIRAAIKGRLTAAPGNYLQHEGLALYESFCRRAIYRLWCFN